MVSTTFTSGIDRLTDYIRDDDVVVVVVTETGTNVEAGG